MDEWEDDARAEWRSEVLSHCEELWCDTYHRAAETLDRLRCRKNLGPCLRRVRTKLETDIEKFTDEQFDEVAESLADSAYESRDPYGYRGVSRKDFT